MLLAEPGAEPPVKFEEPQETPEETAGEPPPHDPLIAGINAELDRTPASAGDGGVQRPEPQPRTTGFRYYLSVASALAFVLGLIILVGYAARRIGKRTPLLAGADLGNVLGRVYLARGASLHFVRTGGKVLIVGLTNGTMSLIAEFDEAAFEEAASSPSRQEFSADSFLSQLQQSSQSMRAADPDKDDDITALRDDIERLQQRLREESRGTAD